MKSIGVKDDTHEELVKFCKKHNLSMGEFVAHSLAYFKSSGVNPSTPPESVKEELAKIEKRVSQGIAFQKTFEKDKLNPLLSDLAEAIVLINKSGAGATNEEVGQWVNKLFGSIAEKMHKPQTAAMERIESELKKMGGDIKKQLDEMQQQLTEQGNKKGLFR